MFEGLDWLRTSLREIPALLGGNTRCYVLLLVLSYCWPYTAEARAIISLADQDYPHTIFYQEDPPPMSILLDNLAIQRAARLDAQEHTSLNEERLSRTIDILENLLGTYKQEYNHVKVLNLIDKSKVLNSAFEDFNTDASWNNRQGFMSRNKKDNSRRIGRSCDECTGDALRFCNKQHDFIAQQKFRARFC